MLKKYRQRKARYDYVIPDLEKWPIVRLSRDKEAFLEEIKVFTKDRILARMTSEEVSEEIARTIYLERRRAKEDPWRVDPKSERKFWKEIRKGLVRNSLDNESMAEVEKNNDILLNRIIDRYAKEIVGNFKIKTYKFARVFLTFAFTRLLNSAANKNIFKIFGKRHRLQEKIRSVGEIEMVRELTKKGTIVLVPTHFSNLDSILIGLTVDFIGLPAVSYGAGLNLFNVGSLAYFMNRLGAYRIDRRKKNSIYLETLKSHCNIAMQRNTHSLFFPGGTRERSGQLEKKLKKGILSTVIEAQRANLENDKSNKIFIVPVVLGYHFVLEAKTLIEQYLKRIGEEKYITERDEFNSSWQVFKFIWKFFGASSEIILSYGQPMDVFGNIVDENGQSHDVRGNAINIKDYFMSNGELTKDLQRDGEYTKLLAEVIVERFHKENVVLSSHIMAFTAFNLFKKQHPKLDIYGMMRLNIKEIAISLAEFQLAIHNIRTKLVALEQQKQLKLAPIVHGTLEDLIKNGIKNLGIYHAKKVLKINKQQQVVTGNMKLLFYYHNKLVGYELERTVTWLKPKL